MKLIKNILCKKAAFVSCDIAKYIVINTVYRNSFTSTMSAPAHQ